MGIRNVYKTLFDIRILHRYFLDEDNNPYVESGGGDRQVRFDNNRLKYDLAKFMKIEPTARTKKVLKNYTGLFQQYKDGIRVALKRVPPPPLPAPDPVLKTPFIPFGPDLYLDFTVEIVDQYFENYTDIVWDKNGLIYLSNLDPVAYAPGSEEEPPAVSVNFSRISSYETDVDGTLIDINLLNDIQASELQNKFGVIRLYLEGEAGELQLSDPGDNTKFNEITPELDLYLTNRRTFWRFRNAADQSIVYTTNNRRPLTENGYMRMPPASENSDFRYANPDAKILVLDSGDFYSEVFVDPSKT